MAVNLLALANQLRGNLHSSPSGSRRRSSDANEPGNLPSGSHIPGTDIKQDAGIRSVARKGRKGDTELRRVGGEVAHVNTTEANAIDALGPMGEAWVQSIGSGTRNPKTGLPEYHLWHKHGIHGPSKQIIGLVSGDQKAWRKQLSGTWKPSEGKWGIFGQTSASKERDRAKAESKVRKDSFENFRRSYEDENIAGIFTESGEDDTGKLRDYTGPQGFEDLIKNVSGLNHPTNNISSNDISDYLDEYDPRKETELFEQEGRDLDKLELAKEGNIAKAQGTGNELASGMFGMLTQSADTTSQQNFAGAGNFAADFQQKQAIKQAEQQFGGIDRERQELAINEEEIQAATASGAKDLQEDYNQEFWDNMVTWESAINS